MKRKGRGERRDRGREEGRKRGRERPKWVKGDEDRPEKDRDGCGERGSRDRGMRRGDRDILQAESGHPTEMILAPDLLNLKKGASGGPWTPLTWGMHVSIGKMFSLSTVWLY